MLRATANPGKHIAHNNPILLIWDGAALSAVVPQGSDGRNMRDP